MSTDELKKQIEENRKKISTDGYRISIGELSSMYKDQEIIINPEYQRYFRWSNNQKSRLIESILLGIPIPPFFVSQRDDGKWEIIDGLQRISTILQFMGQLLDSENRKYERLILERTNLITELENVVWEQFASDVDLKELPHEMKLFFKRSPIMVEIIKKESDQSSKYELFQRLNTLGTSLSAQELRNCLLIMLNKSMYEWLSEISAFDSYINSISISERNREERYEMEMALRLYSLRDEAFDPIWLRKDVDGIITDAMIAISENKQFHFGSERDKFKKTFDYIFQKMEDRAFRKFNLTKNKFEGAFLVSAFECISIGVMQNIDSILNTANYDLESRIKDLWNQNTFTTSMAHGVKANTRSKVLVPFGKAFFAP